MKNLKPDFIKLLPVGSFLEHTFHKVWKTKSANQMCGLDMLTPTKRQHEENVFGKTSSF